MIRQRSGVVKLRANTSERQCWLLHLAQKSMNGTAATLLIRNLLKIVDIPVGPEYLARAASRAVLALDDSAAALFEHLPATHPTACDNAAESLTICSRHAVSDYSKRSLW
jgi:hypothetical protein